MQRILIVVLMMMCAVTMASAQDKRAAFDFSKDRFLAGPTVIQDKTGVDDLFMAGENVESRQDITGNAHLAGRKVVSSGAIGGDAYLSGMDVTLAGKVTGDVTVAGYKVEIGEVDGDVRAMGAKLTLSSPIAGYALVSGDDVTFNSVVTGDVNLRAETVHFADGARIEGKLIIYEEDAGEIAVPAHVMSLDQVERRDSSEWSTSEEESIGTRIFDFFKRVLFYTVLISIFAAIRPQKLTELRQNFSSQPVQNLLFGFLGITVGLGGAILLLFTRIGFGLAVVTVLITLIAAFFGYVIGTYAVGVKAMDMVKRPVPDSLGTRAQAALAGAFILSVIALIPVLGGIVFLAVALIGAGVIVIRIFRPKLDVPS